MTGSFLVTANLPSRNFGQTRAFYGKLGFKDQYVSAQWMILEKAGQRLEFFSHPKLNPRKSWFSVCFRTTALEELHARIVAVSRIASDTPNPMPSAIETIPNGPRFFHFGDPDGTLIRCIEDFVE